MFRSTLSRGITQSKTNRYLLLYTERALQPFQYFAYVAIVDSVFGKMKSQYVQILSFHEVTANPYLHFARTRLGRKKYGISGRTEIGSFSVFPKRAG